MKSLLLAAAIWVVGWLALLGMLVGCIKLLEYFKNGG